MARRELEALLEMGFGPRRAQRALEVTGHRGIEPAMDWLVAHEDDPDLDDPEDAPPLPPPPADVTGGPRPPAQDEETQRALAEAGEERARRQRGQDLGRLRQRLREEEQRRAAAQRQREREEERLARQRVREKIERDKAERAQKFGTGPSPLPEPPPPAPPGPSPPGKKEYEQSHIQVRLPDGRSLRGSFRAREPLAAVRLFVQLRGGEGGGTHTEGGGGNGDPHPPPPPAPPEPFCLRTAFPPRRFTEEDMEKPLQELGLVPSAVLIVAKMEGS